MNRPARRRFVASWTAEVPVVTVRFFTAFGFCYKSSDEAFRTEWRAVAWWSWHVFSSEAVVALVAKLSGAYTTLSILDAFFLELLAFAAFLVFQLLLVL